LKYRYLLLLSIILAACDNPPVPITPSYALSGPTLEASAEFFPAVQTSVPTQQQVVGQNNPTAASLPSGGELPPLAVGTAEAGNPRQPVLVTAGDGTQMNGDLYMAFSDTAAPGILMLAPDRTAWLDLPLRLQNEGFTVMAMDLRPNATVGDVDALLRALTQMETVDAGHMGLIGAEAGADLALVACAQGTPCDAVVMLSPVQESTVTGAILQYNPRPLFMSAGQEDAAFAIIERLRPSVIGVLGYEPIPGSSRGAALLQSSPSLGDHIIEWLVQQLRGG
jgi:dienelactone hydrolase